MGEINLSLSDREAVAQIFILSLFMHLEQIRYCSYQVSENMKICGNSCSQSLYAVIIPAQVTKFTLKLVAIFSVSLYMFNGKQTAPGTSH